MSRRLILAAATLAFSAGAWWSWRGASPSVDGAIEAATLAQLLAHPWQDAQQQSLDMKPLRGRVLVINFWATWCAPCIEEMPELSALALELTDQNVQMLGIAIDSSANVRQFADKHRISYPLPVVGAAGLEWIRGLGNAAGGLPFTVVVDRHGVVNSRVLGRVDIKQLREQLRKLARG